MEATEFEVSAEQIVKAVEIANAFRSAMSGFFKRPELLEDLPAGVPEKATECILAKAFNFNCQVKRDGLGRWYVIFPAYRKKHAQKLAEILGIRAGFGRGAYEVQLPREIGKIAAAFDRGNLDAKYYAEFLH